MPTSVSGPSNTVSAITTETGVMAASVTQEVFVELFARGGTIPLVTMGVAARAADAVATTRLDGPFPVIFVFRF